MVLKVEIYGFMMKIFAPNRKDTSRQEMGRQYLKWCAMKNLWDKGSRLKLNLNCGGIIVKIITKSRKIVRIREGCGFNHQTW